MVRKNNKDYRRWDFEDEETEMGVNEEEMNLDDNEDMIISTSSMTTFVQPSSNSIATASTVLDAFSHRHHSFLPHASPQKSLRGKIHMLCVTLGVFLLGFLLGTSLNVSKTNSNTPRNHPSPEMTQSDAHVILNTSPQMIQTEVNNNSVFNKILTQVTAENIRRNLRRMSQEAHTPGTPEGRSMAMAIRDLWRSYGLSVRVEQHKTLITKTERFNFVEVYDGNDSVSWRTSLLGDDVNLPNSRPLIAFSPPANLNGDDIDISHQAYLTLLHFIKGVEKNESSVSDITTGTLIYGHYGTLQDFQFLERQGLHLVGSIALVRFGSAHLSQVVLTALRFGIGGLVLYPDPADFGPLLPGNAIRRDSLLSLAQLHDHLKHRERVLIPTHTISSNDAQNLLRLLKATDGITTRHRSSWTGGLLRDTYPIGGFLKIGLRIFNEATISPIYNVVAAIPGAWESDRYVIVGCSHDSWTYGAGDPGIGLSVISELTRSFSAIVQSGWRPRRSILFISWDAHLYASSGVSHWLQEHHFEIWSRAVAYVDLSRLLAGNTTLHVVSSPVLREVARKAVQRVKELDSFIVKAKKINSKAGILFSSTLSVDETSFAFFGNLGIPFIRFSVTNGPKGWDYPLFHTSFDTFDNFSNFVDPTFSGAETLGRIISGLIILLVDSSLLPMNVEDYVDEIQRAFGTFMAHYQEDFHRANFSIAYLQAAVMRLEVIGDNFRTDIHNRSVVNPEREPEMPSMSPQHLTNTKKLLFHRISNDKLMELERAFLSRKSESYKHQVLGFSVCSWNSKTENCTSDWSSMALRHPFPRLRQILECRRQDVTGREPCSNSDELSQEIAALIRSLDAAAATLQSPLLPEESDSSIS